MKTPALKMVTVVVATAALALSGCSLTADITTSMPYDPSDGFGVTVADVSVQNLLVVAAGKGEPGVMVGSLTNTGSVDAVVQIQTASAQPEVTVPAGTTVRLGTDQGQELVVLTPQVMPGLLEPVVIHVVGADTATVDVPVFDGTLPEYAPVLEAIPAG